MPSDPQELNQEPVERTAAPLEAEIEHQTGEPDKHDPYAVLRLPDYRRYLTGSVLATAASQMTNVAAAWEVYEHIGKPFALGALGLVAAIPIIALALPAGTLADRMPRKKIVLVADICAAVCLLSLTLVSWLWKLHDVAPHHQDLVHNRLYIGLFYLLILCNGICGAFLGPAVGALVTNLVPKELLPAALKWQSIRGQAAGLVGPVLAGFLVGHLQLGAPLYAFDAIARLIFCFFILGTNPRPQIPSKEKLSWQSVAAGWHFIKNQPLILSTISLDMIAVLFGGVTALLPVYAKDILKVGGPGLGPLYAAQAVGAMLMALFLTHRPPFKHAGKALLLAVLGFGIVTIIFGYSKNYFVSLAALATLGALDNISVVVRHTLLQLVTPDNMRGRVSAVNSVFIGTSNQIGELESGFAAQLMGPVPAVVFGGAMTILVVVAVAYGWPQVRRLGRLEDVTPATAA